MSDVRPPVDPMSDLSWARVERGLWARLDTATTEIAPAHSRRWLWIALPSVAAVGAVAAAFALLIDTPKAVPQVVPLVEENPMRIVSGSSPSTITVGDVHVTLAAESAVVMPRATAHTTSTAVLERGAAWFAIAPRTNRQFVVVAGDAVVRVIGTKFLVARSDERVTVEVERGLVDVTFQGTTVKIAAGQTWSSSPEMASSVEPQVIELPAPAASEAPKQPKRVATKPAIDDEQAKFERYGAIEARDPSAALAGYLELSRGTSVWAQHSLYAAARLAADPGKAHDKPRAKTLLDMYLRRFPRGANADDARQLLDRLKGAL